MLSYMAQPPDLEGRVSALETRLSDLDVRVRRSEQDAAAARVLAGGADRDVTEMRAEVRDFREQNLRVLNAVRQDLTDLRNETRAGFADVDRRFEGVHDGFVEMRGKLDAAAVGQQQIAGLLTTLITQAKGRS